MSREKKDYRDSSIKSTYRTIVPIRSDSKVVVDSDDKRDRAALLDAVEDIMKGGRRSVSGDMIKALFSLIIKSFQNTTDDLVDANDIDWSNVPTSMPRTSGKVYSDRGALKVS